MRTISIISAPSNLGLISKADGKLSGVTMMPQALTNAGLLEKLKAEHRGEVAVPDYNQERDKRFEMTEFGNQNLAVSRKFFVELPKSIQ